MNKLTIIGNLTRDPELRTTSMGVNVCSFTVAVNRRRSSQNSNQPEADFFRVSAWRQLGENCQRYLAKGRKVCVVGPVSVQSYTANDGSTRFSLEVMAEDVEFLSSAMMMLPVTRPQLLYSLPLLRWRRASRKSTMRIFPSK